MFGGSKPRLGMWRVLTSAIACTILATAGLSAQRTQVFRGVIADSMCATAAGHTPMLRPGETMRQCTIACVKRGAKYVLFSFENGMVYQLDDQATPQTFAARLVLIIGNLDEATNTIHVADMILGLPPNISQARSVYLDCGACSGGLATAREAALLEIQDWKRFNVVPDRQRADLIFLFSTKRYLGDYDTGKAPVPVDATYMSVIDRPTGKTLWTDWERSGYMLVSHAAKDLIQEFRVDLEAQEGQLNPLLRRNESRKVKVLPNVGK
jgi:hypothetical protein